MLPPALTSEQWNKIARGLTASATKFPKCGNYEPYANATNWDHDEVYAVLRAEGCNTRSEVCKLIADRQTHGAWPKGRYRAKFWLRARWDQASAYAMHLSEETRHLLNTGSHHTTDDQTVAKWLVWEAWDKTLVDLWLASNIRSYAHFHHGEGIPECFVDYSNWLVRVESGQYIKK